LQAVIKNKPHLIEEDLKNFITTIRDLFGNKKFNLDFGYRMRIGVK
jgi:hypothetical protein